MPHAPHHVAAATQPPARPTAPLPVAALGPRDGGLAPCPETPNCVGSLEHGIRAMPPIAYVGGDRATTEALLLRVLADTKRVRVARHDGDYLRAEFTSRLFGFVDDVEFLFDDAARVIHFRSASRVGRSDLGVNRRRMETLAARLRVP